MQGPRVGQARLQHVRPAADTSVMSNRAKSFAFAGTFLAASLLLQSSAAQAVTFSATGSQTFQTLAPGRTGAVCFTVTVSHMNLVAVTLQSIRFTRKAGGPGTQAQLDAELGAARLYRDGNTNGTFDPGTDPSVSAATAASGGTLFFSPLNVSIPAVGSVTLFVVTDIPLAVRDGDNLDLTIQAGSDFTFDTSLVATGTYPIDPAGSIALDGSSAAQYAIKTIGPGSILAGSTDRPALDVVIPANGYQPDVLEKLAVVNLGTATSASDISAVRAWVDNGDSTFSASSDRLLGSLSFTGDRWQRTGLSEPIPVSRLHVFVTVDTRDFATDGRTVRLGIPSQPDPGVGVSSANDGPIDAVPANPANLTISTADRITLSAAAVPSSTGRPGQASLRLADVVIANSYSVTKTLSEVSFTNATLGPGSRSELDGEPDRLSLWFDRNGDGLLGGQDSLMRTALFQNGEARFSGLSQPLAAGQSRHFFVTCDLSTDDARDGDLIGVSIDGASQVTFDDSTRIFAAWPIDSGARVTVDGMVVAQVAVLSTPALTLGKNEGPALALNVVLPRNGYQDDALNGLSVTNLGTATPSDLAEVRLWRDGGDGQFTPGSGDDQDLGLLTWQVDHWQSGALNQTLPATGARLFVSVTVSGSPVDSSTVRLAIPVGGIVNASGNDGPLDAPVTAPSVLLLSNAPLLASIRIEPPASTVGQSVSATMIVRNVGGESVLNITPTALTPAGTGSLTPVSGPQPPSFNLSSGATDSFLWVYTAASAGDVTLTGAAGGTGSPSGSPRNALPSASNTHQVFTHTQSISFAATSTLPTSVNRGQQDVAAMSLAFTNPGNAQSSTVRLLGVRVRLEDATGAGIVPSSLLSKIVVREGGNVLLNKSSLETSGSDVDLAFASPTLVAAGASATLAISVDVLSSTTAPEFRLSIVDSTVFTVRDQLSGAPVAVTQGGGYPVRTSVARVVAPATELDVAGQTPVTNRVGRGMADVPLLGARLQSPGIVGITSDVRLYAFSAVLEDTSGVTVPRPADFLSFVRVLAGTQTLVARPVSTAEGPALALTLNLPLSVQAGTPVDVSVRADVSGTSQLGALRLRLLDPPTVDARDENTRDPVPAVYAVSPILGNTIVVEGRADSLRVAGVPSFPSRATVGSTNVTALRMTLRHPGSPGTARIDVGGVTIQCRDESRRPLIPADYLSRVALVWNGGTVSTSSSLPTSGGSVTVPLPDPLLEPGESASLDVVVDFSATAPASSIELMIFGDGIPAEDSNLGTPVALAAEAGSELPLASGLCRLEPPPRQLLADFESRMPAALAPDGRSVTAAVLTLTNTAQAGADSILVDHLTVRGADGAQNAASVGDAATMVEVWLQSARLGQSAALTTDSVTASVALTPPLRLGPGVPAALELRLATATTGYPTAFRMGCDAAGIGVVQPSSALLQISVDPVPGKAFPFWTTAGVFGAASLSQSYSNFPNPFAAGRGATAFAYYLRGAGRVTLRITTPTGEGVTTVVADAARPAGMNQSDSWDGRNGQGSVVRNGVYIAELSVSFADGTRDRVRRKVAVVR